MGAVTVRAGNSFLTEIDTGTFKFIADEPSSAGGTDAGPTPYDFLSAALGGCTAMTLHFIARRDSIPLEGVELTITNDRMHAKDCADCLTTSGYIHRFDVKMKLLGNLTPEQRAKLTDIARRCPVYKTLTNEIRINEVVVE
ncbi:MAG TPA: OsmC family protein [Thermoanaerobaculia bacterium]|nr:OsmC family protein [Thermoanaerobaculia bacterium]